MSVFLVAKCMSKKHFQDSRSPSYDIHLMYIIYVTKENHIISYILVNYLYIYIYIYS